MGKKIDPDRKKKKKISQDVALPLLSSIRFEYLKQPWYVFFFPPIVLS